ncbi:MAG: metallophosphoesterase, partial [Sulfuricaulis sp.]|nr:metallophosphoesterase [Sulfuricaulis sp.]
MAVYAIGDVQGCYPALMKLLAQIGFDPDRDRLWFTGDLVNRGPQSLEVLRLVKGLGERAECVLGNHDLHLLAVAAGAARLKKRDTFDDILQATDRNELLQW